MSLPSAVIGKIVAVHGIGEAQVEFPGNPEEAAVRACSTVALHPANVGSRVALVFENAAPDRPIVIGVLPSPGDAPHGQNKAKAGLEIRIDGEQLVLTGEREISLRCGNASITLTKAGKVLIQGAYVLSRSSGTHRIKGASVQIN